MGSLLRTLGATVAVALLAAAARADEPAPLDLAKVEGADQFPGNADDRAMLAKNGFVVLPRFHEQIFSPYIGGDLPYYVTCDSAHHTYQVLFESALKEIERAVARDVRVIVTRLATALAASPPTTPRLREGHSFALAHVEVARRLLGEPPVDRGTEAAVDAEVTAVEAASGISPSALSGEPEDYPLYRPRGFYVGDPTLERHFRTVTWLGRRGFRVANERETAAALLVVRAIRSDEACIQALGRLEDLLGTLLGAPDDLTVREYETAIGKRWTDAELDDVGSLRKALAALRDPTINTAILMPDEWKEYRARTKGLRLMPSRVTPDGRLFQVLLEEKPERSLPGGLEVAASLGSSRAAAHLGVAIPPVRLEGTHYGATLRAAAQMFDATSPLFGGDGGLSFPAEWIEKPSPTIPPEAKAGAEGTPVFPAPLFRTPAWHDRLLATALASWSGLRHAWVLHAKSLESSAGATQDPTGVVEPAPRYFAALAELARAVSRKAESAGAFRRDPGETLDRLLPLLERIADGQEPTKVEWQTLAEAGSGLDGLLDEGGPASWKPLLARLRAWRAGTGTLDAAERARVDALGVSDAGARLAEFVTLMERLAQIAQHELDGVPLTEEEGELVKEYGKTIAGLQGFEGNSWLSPDLQMGWIVDVGSDPRRGERREVGVGGAMELYVALPLRGGGTRLYQGGVYSYYEFAASTPMTDDEWRGKVEARSVPPPPAWTRSYVAWSDVSKVVARIRGGEVVPEVESLRDPAVVRALLDELKTAPRERTEAEDERHAWLLESVAEYPDDVLRPEIWEQLLRRVLGMGDEVSHAEEAAGSALAAFARPADRPKLVALLLAPPAGSVPQAAQRLREVLLVMADGPTPAEVEPLLVAPAPRTREIGVDLLLSPLQYDDETPVGPAVERAFALLDVEKDPDVLRSALEKLGDLGKRVDRVHAPHVAPHLASADADVRQRAVRLLGAMRAADEAHRIFPLLRDPIPRVATAAAEALGEALHGAEDAAAVSRAARELGVIFRISDWQNAVAAVRGLGELGGAEAAAELAKVAGSADGDPRMRSIATEALGDAGEAAIPYLYRLSFDETPTGNSTNSHAIRVCDVAVGELDDLLGGKFGWSQGLFVLPEDEKDVVRILAAVRAEARRLGHAPP